MECETCLNSRPVISENGIHYVCCLSDKKAVRCIFGMEDCYVGAKMNGGDAG